MASQPFNPAETTPGDTDVVANFPSAERTFRDVMESWLLVEHGRTGHHALPKLTTSERDAITTWEAGSVLFNETLGVFQILDSADPDVWTTPTPEFPSGTRMAFQQTSAPTGWTKVTDAAYNNVAFRLITGTVSSGGTVDFTTAFGAAVTGSTVLTVAQLPPHAHDAHWNARAENNNSNYVPPGTEFLMKTSATDPTNSEDTSFVIENTGLGEGHTHPLDLRVKYRDFILAEKA
jgi:hypothetical protein